RITRRGDEDHLYPAQNTQNQNLTTCVGAFVNLGIDDFRYADLYDYGRLQDLAAAFDGFLKTRDEQLFARFESYRIAMQSGIAHGGLTEPQESELLILAARHLGSFVARLFRTDPTPVRSRTQRDSQVAKFKKEFVSKRVAKVTAPSAVSNGDARRIIELVSGERNHDFEYAFAVAANRLLDLERGYPRGAKEYTPNAETRAGVAQIREALGQKLDKGDSPEAAMREGAALHAIIDALADWAAAQWKAGAFEGWTSFHLPKPVIYDHLVGEDVRYRRRDGFKLTDNRKSPREITDQAHYCI